MSIHPQQKTSPANTYGLLNEIQEQIMEAQAEMMELAKRVLCTLRKLRDAQFALSMQIGAIQAVVA